MQDYSLRRHLSHMASGHKIRAKEDHDARLPVRHKVCSHQLSFEDRRFQTSHLNQQQPFLLLGIVTHSTIFRSWGGYNRFKSTADFKPCLPLSKLLILINSIKTREVVSKQHIKRLKQSQNEVRFQAYGRFWSA